MTAEQAQALSLEFVERLLQGRFEAVVATHIDHEHIHSHIVFNAVSCSDGGMFRDDFKAYYQDIRSISNAVSREHGLSVIELKGRGKHYAEWEAEKRGKPTIWGLVRRDVDDALASAVSLQTFFAALEKQGYTVKRGPRVKHTAIRPPGAERFIRLDSLGTGYTEGELKARIGSEKPLPPRTAPVAKRYKVKRKPTTYIKPKGLRRLYLHYLFLLAPPKGCRSKSVPFHIRVEVRRLTQYKRQFSLLQKYRIENEVNCPCWRMPCRRRLTLLFLPGGSCTAGSGGGKICVMRSARSILPSGPCAGSCGAAGRRRSESRRCSLSVRAGRTATLQRERK